MKGYSVLTFLGEVLISIEGFDHYPDASAYVFKMQQETTGLKFYIVKMLAMSKSKRHDTPNNGTK